MSTAVEAIDKRQYRNNTGGYIGVVTLDHLGQQAGTNIDPGGTIWLSEAEAILTARAPHDAKHNPFLEQEFRSIDRETGEAVYQKVPAVSLVDEESRSMYGLDRFVPGVTSDEEARAHVQRAARDGTGGTITPAAAARSAQIVAEAEVDGSWVAPPEAPGQVLPGSLYGSNDAPPAPTTSAPTPVPAPPAQSPAPPMPAAEELAAVQPAVPEERGALTNGKAIVEGEYSQLEETGTDQLGADDDDTEGLIG